MKFDKQYVWIRVLALIGFALTVKLAMIYYSANYDQYALSSFCSINDFIDCDGVAKTTTSQFLGIPLAAAVFPNNPVVFHKFSLFFFSFFFDSKNVIYPI